MDQTPTVTPSSSAPALKPSPFYRGFTLGIAGFVVSFGVSILGLILSIIAYRQSREEGYKNGLALAGIIVGAAGTLFWTAYIGFFVLIIATGALNSISTAP